MATPRTAVKKISNKRLAALGGRVPFSTIAQQKCSVRSPQRGEAIRPRKRPKPVNAKRKAKEFKRTYCSVERVEFVKEQPCAACHRLFASENAHVVGNGGAGRKAGYETIAPLCGPNTHACVGCHQLFDEYRSEFEKAYPDFNPEAAAAATQRAWLAFIGESANDAEARGGAEGEPPLQPVTSDRRDGDVTA